ncbi:MAG: hypothetical protein CVV42_10660 [Candidatus Riflebacteria bacterium HGW-Riflebacteria-2]|jgi:hypothetical protein|nr:MAG: hypothetical protein CVV42_10660 [Candidatus Riflebacteria bacterium HGW-Riflebacteria-2]
MKINTKFLQLHQKDGVTSVTGVTRSVDGCFSCNTKNSQGATRVTVSTGNVENVTPVTPEKKMVLQPGTAADEVVTLVTPVTLKNPVTDKFLYTTRSEETARSQPSGAIQNIPAMPEHGSVEVSTAQIKPEQHSEIDAERLSAWERGELVTIPHTAESVEIYQALELEHRANQIGMPEVADELCPALATIDQIDQLQRPDDFDFALSVLRSVTEDAANHLSLERAAA